MAYWKEHKLRDFSADRDELELESEREPLNDRPSPGKVPLTLRRMEARGSSDPVTRRYGMAAPSASSSRNDRSRVQPARPILRAATGSPQPGARTARLIATAQQQNGEPLPEPLKSILESMLDTELSRVRLHTDSAASDAAKAVSANAFTLGPEIYFRAGKFQPDSPDGQRLLAHEVAHTVQDPASSGNTPEGLSVSSPGDHLEREAEAFAELFTRLLPASMAGSGVVDTIDPAMPHTPDSDRDPAIPGSLDSDRNPAAPGPRAEMVCLRATADVQPAKPVKPATPSPPDGDAPGAAASQAPGAPDPSRPQGDQSAAVREKDLQAEEEAEAQQAQQTGPQGTGRLGSTARRAPSRPPAAPAAAARRPQPEPPAAVHPSHAQAPSGSGSGTAELVSAAATASNVMVESANQARTELLALASTPVSELRQAASRAEEAVTTRQSQAHEQMRAGLHAHLPGLLSVGAHSTGVVGTDQPGPQQASAGQTPAAAPAPAGQEANQPAAIPAEPIAGATVEPPSRHHEHTEPPTSAAHAQLQPGELRAESQRALEARRELRSQYNAAHRERDPEHANTKSGVPTSAGPRPPVTLAGPASPEARDRHAHNVRAQLEQHVASARTEIHAQRHDRRAGGRAAEPIAVTLPAGPAMPAPDTGRLADWSQRMADRVAQTSARAHAELEVGQAEHQQREGELATAGDHLEQTVQEVQERREHLGQAGDRLSQRGQQYDHATRRLDAAWDQCQEAGRQLDQAGDDSEEQVEQLEGAQASLHEQRERVSQQRARMDTQRARPGSQRAPAQRQADEPQAGQLQAQGEQLDGQAEALDAQQAEHEQRQGYLAEAETQQQEREQALIQARAQSARAREELEQRQGEHGQQSARVDATRAELERAGGQLDDQQAQHQAQGGELDQAATHAAPKNLAPLVDELAASQVEQETTRLADEQTTINQTHHSRVEQQWTDTQTRVARAQTAAHEQATRIGADAQGEVARRKAEHWAEVQDIQDSTTDKLDSLESETAAQVETRIRTGETKADQILTTTERRAEADKARAETQAEGVMEQAQRTAAAILSAVGSSDGAGGVVLRDIDEGGGEPSHEDPDQDEVEEQRKREEAERKAKNELEKAGKKASKTLDDMEKKVEGDRTKGRENAVATTQEAQQDAESKIDESHQASEDQTGAVADTMAEQASETSEAIGETLDAAAQQTDAVAQELEQAVQETTEPVETSLPAAQSSTPVGPIEEPRIGFHFKSDEFKWAPLGDYGGNTPLQFNVEFIGGSQIEQRDGHWFTGGDQGAHDQGLATLSGGVATVIVSGQTAKNPAAAQQFREFLSFAADHDIEIDIRFDAMDYDGATHPNPYRWNEETGGYEYDTAQTEQLGQQLVNLLGGLDERQLGAINSLQIGNEPNDPKEWGSSFAGLPLGDGFEHLPGPEQIRGFNQDIMPGLGQEGLDQVMRSLGRSQTQMLSALSGTFGQIFGENYQDRIATTAGGAGHGGIPWNNITAQTAYAEGMMGFSLDGTHIDSESAFNYANKLGTHAYMTGNLSGLTPENAAQFQNQEIASSTFGFMNALSNYQTATGGALPYDNLGVVVTELGLSKDALDPAGAHNASGLLNIFIDHALHPMMSAAPNTHVSSISTWYMPDFEAIYNLPPEQLAHLRGTIQELNQSDLAERPPGH